MKKINKKDVVNVILIILVINLSIATAVQSFKCDRLTKTQLFKRTIEIFFWDFIECDSDF